MVFSKVSQALVVGLVSPLAVVSSLYAADSTQGLSFLPFLPNVSASILTGAGTATSGELLLPIYGNSSQVFYSALQGRYGANRNWLGGLGIGYRRVINNAIVGGYLFTDRSAIEQSPPFAKKSFWTLNPGFEYSDQLWQFRANIYIPTSPRKFYGKTEWASDLANNNYIIFQGHGFYDHKITPFRNLGTGGDLSFARQFLDFKKVKMIGGVYHFNFKDADKMNGVMAGVEYAFRPNFKVAVFDYYDNYNYNNVLIGLKFNLGGNSDADNSTIASHLLDANERHLGSITDGNAVPVIDGFADNGINYLKQANIWFFNAQQGSVYDATKGLANCTAENPCLTFNQAALDGINTMSANATLYLAPGQYQVGANAKQTAIVDIAAGQSIYGRTSDYKAAADQNNRPVLLGGLTLNSNNTLADIALKNINADTAIEAINAKDITLHNLSIGDATAANNYSYGIGLLNVQNLLLDNVYMQMTNNANFSSAEGIYAINSSLIIKNSTFDIKAKGIINADIGQESDAYATGICLGNSQLQLIDSNIQATANTQSSTAIAEGIDLYNKSSAKITTSKINTLASNQHSLNTSVAISIALDQSKLVIDNSELTTQTTSDFDDVYATGISAYDSIITATNNKINVLAQDTNGDKLAKAIGIYSDASDLSAQNNSYVVKAVAPNGKIFAQDVVIETQLQNNKLKHG